MATPTNVHYSRPNVGPIAGGRTVFGAPAAAQAGASASLAIAKAMAAAATGVMLVTGNVAHSVPLAGSAQAVAAATAALSTSGGLPYLDAQAAALLPGRWVQLTGMGGLNYALITDPSGVANILDYCNKGGSDAPGGRLLFQGGAHTGAGGLTGAFKYDRAGNAWFQITPSYSSTLSHNWDSSCTDPVRGDFYAYSKTSNTVRRMASGSTTWTTIAALNISTPESLSLFWDTARDGLMAWNRNTGLEFWAYSSGAGGWSSRGAPSGLSGALGMAGLFCSATNELFLTDGTTNATRFWMYSAADAFSSALTAPVSVYVAQGGAKIVNHDTGSARVLVTDKTSGATQSFNPISRLWRSFTPSNGAIPLNANLANTGAFSIDIPDLGCTLFFSGNNNGAAPSCYLYKHTRAPILPAVITFTAPGSVDIAPYCENYNASTTLLSIASSVPGSVTLSGSILSASSAVTVNNLVIQETPL